MATQTVANTFCDIRAAFRLLAGFIFGTSETRLTELKSAEGEVQTSRSTEQTEAQEAGLVPCHVCSVSGLLTQQSEAGFLIGISHRRQRQGQMHSSGKVTESLQGYRPTLL